MKTALQGKWIDESVWDLIIEELKSELVFKEDWGT
jgi:hypothetical protein